VKRETGNSQGLKARFNIARSGGPRILGLESVKIVTGVRVVKGVRRERGAEER
jgi:hypothetical protein